MEAQKIFLGREAAFGCAHPAVPFDTRPNIRSLAGSHASGSPFRHGPMDNAPQGLPLLSISRLSARETRVERLFERD